MPDVTILFVDDAFNILKTLKRLCLDEKDTIVIAQSDTEALALIVKGCSPQVVVSDQKMLLEKRLPTWKRQESGLAVSFIRVVRSRSERKNLLLPPTLGHRSSNFRMEE